MKITPLAGGTGVPSASNSSIGQTSPTKIERAKAIMLGQEVSQGEARDPYADDRASLRKIKMRTQMSTNRHELPSEGVQEENPTANAVIEAATQPEIPIIDPNVSPDQAGVVEETKQLSPQYARIAKLQRSLQVKERELAQREEALKTQTALPNSEEFVSKAELKANPLKIFETGVTYDELTEAILNNQSNPIDPQKLRAEIKEDLKKELLGEFSNRDQASEQAVLAEIERDINTVTAQGEQYEAIRQARAQQDVRDLIHRTWKSTGEVMDVNEACELVENQLIEEALPFAKIKKLQSRLNPQPIEAPAQIPAPLRPNTRIMKTLTNRDQASPTSQDRRSRALAAWHGFKRG